MGQRERRKKRRSTLSDESGQLSIDFLTGVTVFALTLIFAFQFMTSMVIPYTTSSDEVIQITSKASDRLYSNFTTDWDTKKSLSQGVFDNRTVNATINGLSTSELKTLLGVDGKFYGLNITVTNLTGGIIDKQGRDSGTLLQKGGTPDGDDTVSKLTRVGKMEYRLPSNGRAIRSETVVVIIKVWE